MPGRSALRGGAIGERDHATQAYGLAVTGGRGHHTGVAGLTLGGGLVWLCARTGSVDNLIVGDLVTADGHLPYSQRGRNADLFWALRGGGGNFGVVTSFEFACTRLAPR